MCHNIKTIAKVKSGELSLCTECNIYHLSFNNLFFEFTTDELKNFQKYIFELEVEYWEYKYACTKIRRKIPIPSLQQNLFLMFSRQEVKELRLLFTTNQNSDNITILDVDDIDYTYSLS